MMNIGITKDGLIRLRDAKKPVVFENEEGEQVSVRIIAGGFEVTRKKEVMIIERVKG